VYHRKGGFCTGAATPLRRHQHRRMNSILNIKLLGQPAFLIDGSELPCVSKKALWLAAYVLLGKTVQTRAQLAALFWGGGNQPHSLGSLRVALTKLPAPVLACLDVQRDRIGVATGAQYALDVEAFLDECEGPQLERLQSAVSRYGGDLFDGVDADEAPEFSDWLFAERARLRRFAHDAHVALAQGLRDKGKGHAEAARAVADRWLKHRPADEAMHRLLMTWLAEDAGNDGALAQYDVYRRALAVTEGAAPSPSMTALAESLRQRHVSSREVPARLAAATAFLGRDTELAALRQSLSDAGCRLLTLHGMGGVGKTRLAMALSESEAGLFADGVFVAALDDVTTPALFAQTVARACGLQPAGSAAPLDLLIAFFRRRSALLVLDNLEHLLAPEVEGDLAAQIAGLLAGTGARLKVLTTSREPLHLQEEWVHEVAGLAYPQAADEADMQSFAAVQLFSQRARQVQSTFSLQANAPDVARICALLEGLPLGLELAASWIGTVPIAELVADLRAHAAALDSRHKNRVARHRSLGAAVAFSWERLTDELRQALSGLAILLGTFSSEAAAEIASASPAAMAALADKALLTQMPDGRWHLHEVVRQFAWEQSGRAPALRDTVRNRRDAYCMTWLHAIGKRLEGPHELPALADIDKESANLREAWQSCARAGNVAALEAAAPAWFDYLECRSFIGEGIAAAEVWRQAAGKKSAAQALFYLGLFQRFGARTADALATLDEAVAALPRNASSSRLLVQARSAKAFTFLLLGRLADAENEAAEVLTLAEQLGDPSLLASACRVLGLAMLQSGRREECRALQQRALALALAAGRPSLLAAAHNNLALAENHLGNYAAAEAGYQSALACWRDLHATANIGRGMHNLGVVSRRQGDNATALTRYRAALEMLRKAGDRNLIALNLMSTGDVLLRLGRAAEAREPALQALEMAEHDGHLLPAMDARIVLAQAATELGDIADAAQHLVIALDAAEKHQFINVLADAILSSARLVLTAMPKKRKAALGWALEIVASNEVSASIRKDATVFCEAHKDDDSPVAMTPDAKRSLSALAAEARAAVSRLVEQD